MTEWRLQGQIPELVLDEGTHWFSVSPVDDGTGHYYLTTTEGENGVGSPLGDGNSFYDSKTLGANFDPMTDWLGEGTWDFSQGIDNVPEPATLVATLACIVALGLRRVKLKS